jgi:co-chaperonin GroES (HSP10)
MGQKDDGAGLVDVGGAPLSSDLVTPGGVAFKDMKEIEPKALTDFVVCEVEILEMETAGGIKLARGDGQPFQVLYKVHSIGPELQMNKDKVTLKVGQNIMPISPEVVEMAGSSKKWAIFHESQIKAVIVEVDSAEDGQDARE